MWLYFFFFRKSHARCLVCLMTDDHSQKYSLLLSCRGRHSCLEGLRQRKQAIKLKEIRKDGRSPLDLWHTLAFGWTLNFMLPNFMSSCWRRNKRVKQWMGEFFFPLFFAHSSSPFPPVISFLFSDHFFFPSTPQLLCLRILRVLSPTSFFFHSRRCILHRSTKEFTLETWQEREVWWQWRQMAQGQDIMILTRESLQVTYAACAPNPLHWKTDRVEWQGESRGVNITRPTVWRCVVFALVSNRG